MMSLTSFKTRLPSTSVDLLEKEVEIETEIAGDLDRQERKERGLHMPRGAPMAWRMTGSSGPNQTGTSVDQKSQTGRASH